MLWRSGYQTVTVEDVPLPVPLEPGIFLALWSEECLKDAAIWNRLIKTEFDAPIQLLIGSHWTPELVASVFPLSAQETLRLEPKIATWRAFDRLGRLAAFVSDGAVAKLAMWGPPTEEAWDEFKACAKTIWA